MYVAPPPVRSFRFGCFLIYWNVHRPVYIAPKKEIWLANWHKWTCRRHPTKCCKLTVNITDWTVRTVLALTTIPWSTQSPRLLHSCPHKKHRVSFSTTCGFLSIDVSFYSLCHLLSTELQILKSHSVEGPLPLGVGATGTVFRLHFLGSVEVDEEGGRKRRKRLKKNMVEVAVTKIKVCFIFSLSFCVVSKKCQQSTNYFTLSLCIRLTKSV